MHVHAAARLSYCRDIIINPMYTQSKHSGSRESLQFVHPDSVSDHTSCVVRATLLDLSQSPMSFNALFLAMSDFSPHDRTVAS